MNDNFKDTIREDIIAVCEEIKKEGGDPIKQLSGYILSEEPIYIPYGKARKLVHKYDRDDILAELIMHYMK